MRRKLLSVLLSLAMVITMMPAMAMTAYAETPAYAASGTGEESDPYIINTLSQLEKLADAVNGDGDYSGSANSMEGKYFKLSANIGDATTGFTKVIGSTENNKFKGNFDGNGHTITVNIDKNGQYIGLFGLLGDNLYIDASISNLTVAGTVKGTYDSIGTHNMGYIGGIVGYCNGTLTNCCNCAVVTGEATFAEGNIDVGGLAGRFAGSRNTKIINCCNKNDVSGETLCSSSVGGLVGEMSFYAYVVNSYNIGNVTNAGTSDSSQIIKAGGVVANLRENSKIKNCYNSGKVTATTLGNAMPVIVGGVVGFGLDDWDDDGEHSVYANNCYFDSGVNAGLEVLGDDDSLADTTNSYGLTTAQMKTQEGGTYSGEGIQLEGKALVDLLNDYRESDVYPDGWKKWVVETDKYPSFEKESQPTATVNTVNMEGYTYGATPSSPSLSEEVKDKATVTYYYSTSNVTSGGTEWKDITGTTLNANDYYMYAVIGDTDNYNGYTTATATKFTVAKADQTAPEDNQGYSLDKKTMKVTIDNGFELSANNEFTSLISSDTALTNNTTYYIRKAETTNYKASPATSFVAKQKFSITYKDKGDVAFTGEHETGYQTEHTYGTATPLKGATKTGYSFGGWFANKECTGDAVTTLGATEYYADITLYAKWTANTYTVKFDANDGSGSMIPQNFTYDQAQNLTTNSFTRKGYDFLGWNEDKEATTATYTDAQEVTNLTAEKNKEITLYAIWKEKNAVTITYKSNDVNKGTVDPASEALNPETGEAQGSTATPTTGYEFVKWTNASGDQVGTNAKYVPTKVGDLNVEATYTANFEANTFDIIYKDQGGAEFSGTHEGGHPTSHKYDVATTLKSATKTGYTFGGWFTNKECTGDAVTNIGAKTYSDDITLYAKWTANTYGVTFVGNFEGSEYSENMTETYDLHYVLPQKNPVRPNHSFAGWFTEAEGGDQVTADSIVQITGDTTLYAHWTAYNIVPVELLTAKTSGSKAVKLSWNSVPGATKYVVYGNKCGKSFKKLKTTTGKAYTVKKISGKKLKAHKNYKFYVVAYTANGTVKSNSIHFITGNRSGKYANVKSIKAKVSTVTLSPGATKKIGATYKMYYGKKHIKKSHGAALRYISNCPSVATVSSSGVVTAKAAGTAIIYIQDIGGKYCKTTVTVE